MADALVTKFPWEVAAAPSTEETVRLMQRDFAYAVTHTGVMVHSKHEALRMLVNTPRGQIIPRNACVFSDGSEFELHDIGMPQPNAPTMTVQELLKKLWETAQGLGLELRR